MTVEDRIITPKELVRIVPYTIQHIGRLEKQGKFPRRIPLGPRRVGWWLSSINQWVAERVAAGERVRGPGQWQ
jgi:prophage regulatory protein